MADFALGWSVGLVTAALLLAPRLWRRKPATKMGPVVVQMDRWI